MIETVTGLTLGLTFSLPRFDVAIRTDQKLAWRLFVCDVNAPCRRNAIADAVWPKPYRRTSIGDLWASVVPPVGAITFNFMRPWTLIAADV